MRADVFDLFSSFLDEPNRERFEAVQAAVVASADYQPYGEAMPRLEARIAAGDFHGALELSAGLAVNYLLCPRYHFLLATAAQHVGDRERAGIATFAGRQCVAGILATGEGSMESPYLVTHFHDEYDVLQWLNKSTFRKQELVHWGSMSLDCLGFADGSELWFDVSRLFRRSERADPEAPLETLGPARMTTMARFVPAPRSHRPAWHRPFGLLLVLGGLMALGLWAWSR